MPELMNIESEHVMLFVDADSCPRQLRSIILKAVISRKVPVLFAADRPLPDVVDLVQDDGVKPEQLPLIQLAIVPEGMDSADDFLVEKARAGMLAITRDVILADRLATKDLVVLDDRGGVFTKETIRERLSMRNLMTALREQGVFAEKTKPLGPREIHQFANALDRELVKLQKNNQ